MSQRFNSKNYREAVDLGSDIDSEVFLSQDEDEHKDGQDVLLGSRLEDELNRSIEKMRQMEDSDVMDENICIENLLDSDTSEKNPLAKSQDVSLRGSNSDELLDDIEMPSLSESACESAELVSISSGSPLSSLKQHSSFWSRESGTSYSDTAKMGKAASSSFQITSSPERKEMDVCEKIALLSAPEAQRFTTLVSLGEDGTAKKKHVATAGSKSSEDESNEEDAMDLMAEKSANMTSSPLSCSHHTALSFELLDLDNINDDLLSSMLIANSPIKEQLIGVSLQPSIKNLQKIISENTVDEQDEIQDLDNIRSRLNQTNTKLNVVSKEDVNSPLPPNHRMTLGTGCELLDLDEMNDSLLTSLHMAKSPIVLDGLDFPLSSPLIEYKRDFIKNAAENQTQSDNMKLNDSFEKRTHNLNITQSLGNKSKSVNDLPKETNTFASLGKAFICLEKLLDGKDGSGDLQNPAMAFNSTYDFKRSKTTLSCSDLKENSNNKGETTFISKGNLKTMVNEGANQTFCAKQTQPVNTTFDAKELPAVDTTFDLKASQANITFDKKDTTSDGMDSPLNRNDQNDAGNLNVTFEKGEYRIATLNETVNLMDAEENVLKLILDSTPSKPSKIPHGASSTPKASDRLDAAAKRTVTKDPAQTFLHRMSLGVRKTCLNTGEDNEKRDIGEQAAGPSSVMPGLKMGYVNQQSVTNQLRRLHSGLARSTSGPMRALPLSGISVGSTGDKSQKDSSPQSDLDGIKALDSSQGGAESRKNKFPSFGSISSLDSDWPGTPDVYKVGSVIAVTPDVFRPSSCSMSPRITSTPATKIGGSYSNVVTMDGPAPTPIAAPPSRSRFGTTSGSSCLAAEQDNPSWEGLSQTSTKSSIGSLNSPAKKALALPIRPSRMYSSASLAVVATPEEQEEHHNDQNIGEDSDVKTIDNEKADKCISSQQKYHPPISNMKPETTCGDEVLKTVSVLPQELQMQHVKTESVINGKDEKQNMRLEISENLIKGEQMMNVPSHIMHGNNPSKKTVCEAISVMETQEVESCHTLNKTIESYFNKEVHASPIAEKQDSPSASVCYEAVSCIPLSKSRHEDQTDGDGHNVEVANCISVVTGTPIPISQTKEMVCGQESSLDGTISCKKETIADEVKTGSQDTEGNGKDQLGEPQNLDYAAENESEKTGVSPGRVQAKNVQSSSKSASSEGKKAAASRRPTTRTSKPSNNGASLPSKRLATNKENIAKNDIKSKTSSQPRVNVRGRSPALKEKLPSQQIKAPSSCQPLKMPKAGDQKQTAVHRKSKSNPNDQNKDAIQKRLPTKSNDHQQGVLLRRATSKSNDKLQKKGLAKIVHPKLTTMENNKMPAHTDTPVKMGLNANSHNVELKAPVTKVNEALLKSAVTKDIPVSHPSKLRAPQPLPVSKLPVGPRIPTGVPVRGMVKSSSSCDPSSFKHLPSRLPGIRPPNSSLPVLPGKSLSSGSLRTGIALPSASRLVKPQRP